MPRPRRKSTKQIQIVRVSIKNMQRAVDRLASMLREVDPSTPTSREPGGRRRPRLSPARKQALKLQGQYMGFMRQLGPRQKAKVRAMKARKGYTPAIALARNLARKAS